MKKWEYTATDNKGNTEHGIMSVSRVLTAEYNLPDVVYNSVVTRP